MSVLCVVLSPRDVYLGELCYPNIEVLFATVKLMKIFDIRNGRFLGNKYCRSKKDYS
jgi:hypothetical protein